MANIHAISVSKSTVMHASLAYMSPELRTMDSIIRNSHSTTTPYKPVLPTEILLLIREWLLPTVTASLIKQSKVALASYERSLRDLLCPDCILYNLDIFGPDIWQWEQFSGACSCLADEAPRDYRSTSTRAKAQSHPPYENSPPPSAGNVNPKQFLDAEHWLEWHLSREERALRVGCRGHDSSSASAPRRAPALDIWDVVASVLREFKCEAVRETDDRTHAYSRGGRAQVRHKRDLVKIVPLQLPGTSVERVSNVDASEDLDWRAQVTLRRASRDLGLLIQHGETFNNHVSHITPPPRRLRWPSVSNACYKGEDMVEVFSTLLRVLISIAAVCLTVPITFTTVAVIILCFYSRPKSFRII